MPAVINRLVRSRVGWLLVIAQLGTIVYWFRRGVAASSIDYLGANTVYTGRFIGNRFVELNSSLSEVLVLSNVIPVVIAQLLSKIVFFIIPSLTVPALSWVHAVELLFLTTVQWLIVGAFIERLIALARDAWFPGTASNKSLDRSGGKRASHQA
jgi:hypothetical protein